MNFSVVFQAKISICQVLCQFFLHSQKFLDLVVTELLTNRAVCNRMYQLQAVNSFFPFKVILSLCWFHTLLFMIPVLSHFLPSLSLLNDSHFPRTVSVLQFTVRFTAYQEKLFKWSYLMLSHMPLLFYFCQDTDLLSVLVLTVCCQANLGVVWVKHMVPVRQLTFLKRMKQPFFLQIAGNRRETFVAGMVFSCRGSD